MRPLLISQNDGRILLPIRYSQADLAIGKPFDFDARGYDQILKHSARVQYGGRSYGRGWHSCKNPFPSKGRHELDSRGV